MNHLQLKQKHQHYLRELKRERNEILGFQVCILFAFLTLWELAGRFTWIDPLLFSYPSKIASLFITKVTDGSLLLHTGVTLLETIAGFLLGTVLGTVFAAILWWSRKASRISDPYLVVLNSMPKVALGPIIIVALGPGYISIITMGASISVIITTLVIYHAFHTVEPNFIKVIRSFGGNKRQIFFEVILPSSFPAIISTLKVNVGLSWVGVIVGEFLVSKQGLGYMIIYGFQVFNFTLVLLSLFMIAILSSIMYLGVEWLERKLIKH
ncbi:ABC transporter permease [Guptibacillus hwajinpoensis]|uniref:ABC transporter permease n=1 Tax=Guptibacillus hwajinpoensis TaxID=208199 RepID=UPI001CFD84D2|nr:ABC transporter permease [Pseudalkalibacillus hwajinpoensis]WLR60912.1 ABC transporter permease [Pseudalkalibacillus hwajinpoensis]